jgi:hypothetical protein
LARHSRGWTFSNLGDGILGKEVRWVYWATRQRLGRAEFPPEKLRTGSLIQFGNCKAAND